MLGLVGINSMIKMKTIRYLQELNFSVFETTHDDLASVRSRYQLLQPRVVWRRA